MLGHVAVAAAAAASLIHNRPASEVACHHLLLLTPAAAALLSLACFGLARLGPCAVCGCYNAKSTQWHVADSIMANVCSMGGSAKLFHMGHASLSHSCESWALMNWWCTLTRHGVLRNNCTIGSNGCRRQQEPFARFDALSWCRFGCLPSWQ